MTVNSKVKNNGDPAPRPGKRPYQAPKLTTEKLHETATLICGKNAPVSQDCFAQPSSS